MIVILKTGVRVLKPDEYEALLGVIAKPSLKKLVQVLMLTGMRYQEVINLKKDPLGFQDNSIHIKSGKKMASPERYVNLTPAGIVAVRAFLDDERSVYPSTSGMTHNLVAWAELAGLAPSPQLVGKNYSTGPNVGIERKNVCGMSVKSFRKSWESWLVASYPQQAEVIATTMGHTTTTSMKHYMSLPFTPEEKEQIQAYTAGWMGNGKTIPTHTPASQR